MPVFAVIRQSTPSDALGQAIAREYAEAHYDLGDGVWLVAGSGTAKDVADKVGITPAGAVGTAIVLEAASYYGRANPAIWS
jgi:hypothetical protein